MSQHQFAIIVTSQEVRDNDGHIMTKAGERFLLTEGEWVDATSIRLPNEDFPKETKSFPSRAKAKAFAKRWIGHPWWCKPTGEYEIVEIKPAYKSILSGYTPTSN